MSSKISKITLYLNVIGWTVIFGILMYSSAILEMILRKTTDIAIALVISSFTLASISLQILSHKKHKKEAVEKLRKIFSIFIIAGLLISSGFFIIYDHTSLNTVLILVSLFAIGIAFFVSGCIALILLVLKEKVI